MVGSGGSGPRSGAGGDRRETPKRIDRYEIRRVLGRGAQGIVYHGYDPNFDIEVAIKVFRQDEFSERNRIEAQTAVRLVHPNIVRVLDFKPEYPYLVMEYCGDGDLERYIKSCRRRSVAEILTIVRQICEALVASHEHERPILHRDLKPSNVLFQKGVPKVADFGLAKIVGGAFETSTRGWMGTAFYCSPEQFRDASKVDHRADLWSVGVILYEMATWTMPFGRPEDKGIDVAIRVRTEPPNDPPYEMPPPLRTLTFKTLQKNPDHRFSSAREMIRALDQVLVELPDHARLLLPPEHVLNDQHRLAARVAELMQADRVEEAVGVVQNLTSLDPDSLLAGFWDRRLRQMKDESLSSVPGGASGPEPTPSPGRFDSIQSHIASRAYGRARDDILKWLQDEPGNTMALWLLEKVNEDERRFKDDLKAAREKADVARAAGDVRAVSDVWKSFLEKYPDFPEAQAELGVAMREMEVHEQRRLREDAVREARRQVESASYREAAAAWKPYVERYPQDRDAAREMQTLFVEASKREREVRLAGLRASARKLHREGDLLASLKAWDEVLREDPSSAEGVEAERTIRAEIAAKERARRFDEAAARAEGHRGDGDLPGALRAFEQFLLAYPADPEASGRLQDLRREQSEIERRALRDDVERLLATLEESLAAGRYGGVPGARDRVEREIRSARSALAGDGAALGECRDRLRDARLQAEAALSAEISTRRLTLLDCVRESRDRLGEAATRERAALPSEEELELAMKRAVETLCGGSPNARGDPAEQLARMADVLSTAVAAVDRDRRQAVADAGQEARRASSEARVALESFVAETPPGAVVAGGDRSAFDERLRRLGQEVDSPVAERLQQARLDADALRHEVDAARVAALARLGEHARKLVDQGAALLSRSPSERLEALLHETVSVLEPREGESALPAGALAKTCGALAAELSSAARAYEERMVRGKARWTAVAEASRRTKSGQAGAEIVAKGEAALRSGRPEEIEAEAAQLDGLLRGERLQSLWAAHADAVAEIEGALDQDGLPVEDPEPEDEHLLRRYREAVVQENETEIGTLASALEKRRPAQGGQGAKARRASVRMPVLSRRKRRVNERCNPAALAQCDEIAAQLRDRTRQGSTARLEAELARAERRLLEPTALWRRWVPAAAALGIVAAVWSGIRSEEHTVQVMGLGGEVEVASVLCNGKPVQGLTLRIPGGQETVPWQLAAGHCEVTTAAGGRREFDVPADGLILLPTGDANYRQALLQWMDLGNRTTADQ